jgi:hypothetical protein
MLLKSALQNSWVEILNTNVNICGDRAFKEAIIVK